MKMVGDQSKSVDRCGGINSDFAQAIEERESVLIIGEYLAALDAPTDNVI